MTASGMLVEAIKITLNSGTADSSTVGSLRRLLGLEAVQETLPLIGAQPVRKDATKPKAPATARGSKARTIPVIAIREDSIALPSREAKALATETINISLKVLTSSLRAAAPPIQTTPPRALHPCSGNSTPTRSPTKSTEQTPKPDSSPAKASRRDALPQTEAIAECAGLSFTYLRAASPSKSGVCDASRLQLEAGALALVGKLVAHGLQSQAMRELRIVKRSVETIFPLPQMTRPSKPAQPATEAASERKTLIRLLSLDASFDDSPATLAFGISYHMHVLKLIAISRIPAAVEAVVQHASIERDNSASGLISRLARQSDDTVKAYKQLEALSQTLLSLCPSIASSADATAVDSEQCPSPSAVFQLQVAALQLRRRGWDLTGQQVDMAKQLVDPFTKCASAFVRRSGGAKEVCRLLEESYEALGPFDSDELGQTLFGIHNLLSSQCERGGLHDRAIYWAEKIQQDCQSLEANHARRVAVSVHAVALRLKLDSPESLEADMTPTLDVLEQSLTGCSADYDILLTNLTSLVRALMSAGKQLQQSTNAARLIRLIASFALRYSRSYPERSALHVQFIIETALHQSKSTDDLLAWVTDEAAAFFIRRGTLKDVAAAASTKSLSQAWIVSSAGVALGRLLRALMVRSVRTASDALKSVVFDDEALAPAERGVLLEWQLRYAVELAGRAKYHEVLRKILPELSERLHRAYSSETFPVRRARVALGFLNLRESHPKLLPQHAFDIWHEDFQIDSCKMGDDAGLAGFIDDLQASINVTKAFAEGRATTTQLNSSVQQWHVIVNESATKEDFRARVEDPNTLVQLLQSVAAYLCMLGEDAEAISVRRLLVKVLKLLDEDSSATCTALVELAEQHLSLQYSERAGDVLNQAQKVSEQQGTSDLARLQYHLAQANHLLAIDNTGDCAGALNEAKQLRDRVPPESIHRDERKPYEMLHAEAWLLHSRHMHETGSPHQALTAAKRSVKVFNSMWSAIERATGQSISEPATDKADASETAVNGLAKGISKLQLTPTDDNKSLDGPQPKRRGAAFWPIVPLISQALLHLSDMYTHHGLFNEANYYSERAISLAKSVGPSQLLSRLRNHRSRLLTLAGKTEEAELCLAQEPETDGDRPSLGLVDRLCSEAGIKAKERSWNEAFVLYEKAKRLVEEMGSEAFVVRLEGHGGAGIAEDCGGAQSTPLPSERKPAKKQAKTASRKAPVAQATKKPTTASTTKPAVRDEGRGCYLLAKLKADVVLRKAISALHLGRNIKEELDSVAEMRLSAAGSLQRRLVQHEDFLRQATAALEMDVTLNVLAESTLSLPAMMTPAQGSCYAVTAPSNSFPPKETSKKGSKAAPKVVKSKVTAENSSKHLLDVARDCLLKGFAASVQFGSTAQTHAECSKLSSVTLLLSAIASSGNKALHPSKEGLAIDLPRIKVLQFERQAAVVDGAVSEKTEPLSWPNDKVDSSIQTITSADFQEKYVDIIPKTWTAVSLCLSEDESELLIARYRAGQNPLILKLPFARHKPNGLDDAAFNYHQAKAELREIIDLSNYSCHNPGSLEAKGAKTKWWNEREALDRRLQELLINIESLWLGGFKSVLSRHVRHPDLLARFRKSFDGILDRHLPSRKGVKGQQESLALDGKVLELFIGLGDDRNGTIDLDEPLADLLYFVVDMLQFNGERNAYDEIDFDGMTVDVVDALHAYHEACASESEPAQHLILILDRRLQAFPWESLPCLEGASVSRVGSLLSLRERVVAMREAREGAPPNTVDDRHFVPRGNGNYILNPSSDLAGTQKMLEPALSSLTKADGSRWNSMVGQEPNEESFSAALSGSSITLYFGHGAGSQYIRPRAIKRLEQCSEVVWLMGCSSGAVTEYGELEPCAVPLAYLLAGAQNNSEAEYIDFNKSQKCMAVVATLWDVTDKDIDRFSLEIGEDWGLWQPSEQSKLPAKTPRKREIVAAPSTPQQVPKTPKTPKVRKTPAAAKTPVRNRSRGPKDTGSPVSIVEAVARNRDACYLRYLNGAAPVVYGVPVYLGD